MTERQDCREAFLDHEDYQTWKDECNEAIAEPTPEMFRSDQYRDAETAYHNEANPELAEELFTALVSVNYHAIA